MEPLVDFVPTYIASAAVKLVFHSFDVGDPTVGMAVEVGTHVSEDNVWHMRLGVCPCECDSPLVGSPGKVPGNSLRPLVVCFKVDEFGSFH